ncbi:MAG TPA: TRAP transporter small permease [Burkholderiales bacterium]|nr:TRAP transporter small permease [Burkholderiales bacterium]
MTPRFARLARRLEAVLGLVAGVLLFAMMILTFADVMGRYLFNHSVPGGFEITEILMAMLIFAGLPLVSRREEHVSVDLLDHLMPPAMRRAVRVIMELAGGALLLGLAYLMWHKARQVAAYGDTTTVLQIRYAPYVYAIVVFLVIAGAVHLVNVFAPDAARRDESL